MPRVKPENIVSALIKTGDTKLMTWEAFGRIIKREKFELFDIVQFQVTPQPLMSCLATRKQVRNTLALCNSKMIVKMGGVAKRKFECNINIDSPKELPNVKQPKMTCYWINHEPYMWNGYRYFRGTFHQSMTWRIDWILPCYEPSIVDSAGRIADFDIDKGKNARNNELENELIGFKKENWKKENEKK